MKKVVLSHGAGGEAMQEFLSEYIFPALPNMDTEVPLRSLDDSAVVDGVVFTTDGHTVKPLFFPGGDIGVLAVSGTVNDIAVMGARPLALSCSMVIEEGLPLDSVRRVMTSIGECSRECGVPVVTGDTKVVESGAVDEMIVVTSAIGKRSDHLDHNFEVASQYRKVESDWLTDDHVREGDAIIASGFMGDHGVSILSFREGYGFDSEVQSDVAPLNGLIESVLRVGGAVSMKDPTRGGLANMLNEWASKSNVGIDLKESAIPLSEATVNACELLGIEPLTIGNEGKVVIACVPEMAEEIVATMRRHPLGRNSAIIGKATGAHGRVVLRTEIGGRRILEPPVGDPVPRIC